jgi:hypothetical protein
MTQKTHVIHGRDHQHGGMDPLRMVYEDVGAAAGAAGGIAVAMGSRATGQSVVAGGTAWASFTGATTSTTDPSIISWGTTVLANDTLNFHAAGTVLMICSCYWATGGNLGDFHIYESSANYYLRHGPFAPAFNVGPAPPSGFATHQDLTIVGVYNGAVLRVQIANTNTYDTGPSDFAAVAVYLGSAHL